MADLHSSEIWMIKISEEEVSGSQRSGTGISIGWPGLKKGHSLAPEALLLCPSSMLWRTHIDTDAMNQEIGVVGIGCD